MIQKMELITKKLTKLINSKNQKEAEVEKLKGDVANMNQEIFDAEVEMIDLIKVHQKEIKPPKKRVKKETTKPVSQED